MNTQYIIENTDIPASLVEAVVNQFGDWEEFESAAPDVVSHGIDGGFAGFIYYTDTVKFAQDNRDALCQFAEEEGDECGVSAVELVAGFNCLDSDTSKNEIAQCLYGTGDDTQIMNALAWFAAEEVCRAYENLTELA